MRRSSTAGSSRACAFFTLLVTNGLTFAGITVFDESMLREFGWSRGTLKFRDMLTMGLAGLLSPLAGAIADKYGVKWLMAGGAALLAVALLALRPGRLGAADVPRPRPVRRRPGSPAAS